MIPTNFNSTSIIISSTHILHFRIDRADVQSWSPHPSGWQERRANLTISLLKNFKGEVDQKTGSSFELSIIQLKGSPLTLIPVPGVWSECALESGAEYVAFSRGDTLDAAELLKEPLCVAIYSPAETLADLELTTKLENENASVGAAIESGVAQASQLHALFVDYLWAKWKSEILADKENFDRITTLLETPPLSYGARATLLNHLINEALSGETPRPLTHRLSLALFELLDLAEAAAFHDNIITTYLPSLLGLGSANEIAAADLFAGSTTTVLQRYSGSASPQYLLDWLNRTG